MSLFSALPMLVGVNAGRLVDRIGIRRPILISASVLFAAVAAAGFFPYLATLFVVSAVVGTSFMLFHICVQHAVGEMKGERIVNFGWLALGFSFSNFIAPTFTGFAIDTVGHANTFRLLAVFALVALALLARERALLTHVARE